MAALLSKIRNPLAFNATSRILFHAYSPCRNLTAGKRVLLATCTGVVQLHSHLCVNPSRTTQSGFKLTADHSELNRKIQCTVFLNLRHLRYRAAPSSALQEAESTAPSLTINSHQPSIFRRSLTSPPSKEERSLDIYTVPNAICVLRIAASPFIGYLVVDGRYEFALCCFVLAGLSDGESCVQFT